MGNRRRMMGLKDRPLTNGVYIEATNGKLFTSDKWTGSLTANSVVVIQDEVRFRIALTQPGVMQINSNHKGALEEYMTSIENESQIKLDMKSAENTANIMKVQSGTGYAAGYCKSFTFPDGKTKGLLPAAGWLWTAYDNKAVVDACLAACGATPMSTDENYWSSTFSGINVFDIRYCSALHWSDGTISPHGIADSRRVRPFAEYV